MSDRYHDRTAACSSSSSSSQSRIAASKVRRSCASATRSAGQPNAANSAALPSRIASPSSPSWSLKYGNGVVAAHSSPWNTRTGERAQQHERRRRGGAVGADEVVQPLAGCPVPDLVVVLQGDHEAVAAGAVDRPTDRPAPVGREPTLIRLGDGECELEVVGPHVLVVAAVLAGEGDVQAVVQVVGPDRVESGTVGRCREDPRVAAVGLRDRASSLDPSVRRALGPRPRAARGTGPPRCRTVRAPRRDAARPTSTSSSQCSATSARKRRTPSLPGPSRFSAAPRASSTGR